jgi:Helix-turn-helix domain
MFPRPGETKPVQKVGFVTRWAISIAASDTISDVPVQRAALSLVRPLRKRKLANSNPRFMASERNATIIRPYRKGTRQADLARQFKISRDRVRQIIEQAKRFAAIGEVAGGIMPPAS